MTRMGLVNYSERFWAKVAAEPAGCWWWTASLQNRGYGQFNLKGAPVLAHRVSYEMVVGPIPSGLHLDHLCRNPSCVNPLHLEPVTPLVNIRRGIGHGHETHCPSGHPYSGHNLYVTPGRGDRQCRTCRKASKARFDGRTP